MGFIVPPPPPPIGPPKKVPCVCLDVAGMLNYTRAGQPIGDCQECDGSGKMDSDDVFGPAGKVFDLGFTR